MKKIAVSIIFISLIVMGTSGLVQAVTEGEGYCDFNTEKCVFNVCTDGIDNDGDGLIDKEDIDCLGVNGGTACDDHSDTDGDGLIDEEDPNCWKPAPNPVPESILTIAAITVLAPALAYGVVRRRKK